MWKSYAPGVKRNEDDDDYEDDDDDDEKFKIDVHVYFNAQTLNQQNPSELLLSLQIVIENRACVSPT